MNLDTNKVLDLIPRRGAITIEENIELLHVISLEDISSFRKMISDLSVKGLIKKEKYGQYQCLNEDEIEKELSDHKNFSTEPVIGKKWEEASLFFHTNGKWAFLRHFGDYRERHLKKLCGREAEANLRYDLSKITLMKGAICVLDPKGFVTDFMKNKEYDKYTVWWTDPSDIFCRSYKILKKYDPRRKIRESIRSALSETHKK